jgi:hypothetical protein
MKLLLSCVHILLLSLSSVWLAAEDTVPVFDPDTSLVQPTVIAVDGLAAFEAEAAYGQSAGTDIAAGASWVEDAGLAGFSGDTALIALPNAGVNVRDTSNGPGLNFALQLDQPATWYVWVRMSGKSGNDDSVHVSLNDTLLSTGRIGMTRKSGNWTWVNHVGSRRVACCQQCRRYLQVLPVHARRWHPHRPLVSDH